jgi:hypothetical protein
VVRVDTDPGGRPRLTTFVAALSSAGVGLMSSSDEMSPERLVEARFLPLGLISGDETESKTGFLTLRVGAEVGASGALTAPDGAAGVGASSSMP